MIETLFQYPVFFLMRLSNFFILTHKMNLKSFLIPLAVTISGIFFFSIVHQVESKGGSFGGRPGSGSRPTLGKPSYKPTSGVSSKGFGAKKVVAFAAGAYVGGKVAKKVNTLYVVKWLFYSIIMRRPN